jgi:hypothetical protein
VSCGVGWLGKGARLASLRHRRSPSSLSLASRSPKLTPDLLRLLLLGSGSTSGRASSSSPRRTQRPRSSSVRSGARRPPSSGPSTVRPSPASFEHLAGECRVSGFSLTPECLCACCSDRPEPEHRPRAAPARHRPGPGAHPPSSTSLLILRPSSNALPPPLPGSPARRFASSSTTPARRLSSSSARRSSLARMPRAPGAYGPACTSRGRSTSSRSGEIGWPPFIRDSRRGGGGGRQWERSGRGRRVGEAAADRRVAVPVWWWRRCRRPDSKADVVSPPLLHSVCPVQVARESHEESRLGSHVFCVDGVSSGRRRAAAAALSDPPIILPTPSPLLPNALVQHPTQERVRSSAGSAGETFDACLPLSRLPLSRRSSMSDHGHHHHHDVQRDDGDRAPPPPPTDGERRPSSEQQSEQHEGGDGEQQQQVCLPVLSGSSGEGSRPPIRTSSRWTRG